MPRAASAGSTFSCVWIAGSRTVRSSSSSCAFVAPSRTANGPYGSTGMCTLATATTRPGEGSTKTYTPSPSGGSTIG